MGTPTLSSKTANPTCCCRGYGTGRSVSPLAQEVNFRRDAGSTLGQFKVRGVDPEQSFVRRPCAEGGGPALE